MRGASHAEESREKLARLDDVLATLIPSHFPSVVISSSSSDDSFASLESLSEAIDYIVTACMEDDVPLPAVMQAGQEVLSVSIVDADVHPLAEILASALTDLLGLSPGPGQVALLTSEVLEKLAEPDAKSNGEDTETSSRAKLRFGQCEMCERQMGLTSHHLIPRSEHTLLVKRQVFSLVEMRSRIAYLCRPCHSAVHAFIPDHAEMAKDWNTVDRLLEHEGVRKWALYASKQKERDPKYGGIRLQHKR